uniref:Uncharacterized protein n=1 Tax=Triticum urartu TaxID=4572 RepID=A0A8R7URD3_TRIUA
KNSPNTLSRSPPPPPPFHLLSSLNPLAVGPAEQQRRGHGDERATRRVYRPLRRARLLARPARSRGPSPPSASPEPPPHPSLLGRGVLDLGVAACGTNAVDDKELHLVHHKDGQRHMKGYEHVMHQWKNLVYEKETYASALFSSFRVPPTDTSTCCSGQVYMFVSLSIGYTKTSFSRVNLIFFGNCAEKKMDGVS